MDFYHYRVDVCTHFQHKFLFKQHVKVNLASDDPFKKVKLRLGTGAKVYKPITIIFKQLEQRSAGVTQHICVPSTVIKEQLA